MAFSIQALGCRERQRLPIAPHPLKSTDPIDGQTLTAAERTDAAGEQVTGSRQAGEAGGDAAPRCSQSPLQLSHRHAGADAHPVAVVAELQLAAMGA